MNEEVASLLTRGIELMSAQMFEDAKQAFARVTQIDRQNIDGYLNLGNAAVSAGEIDEGIAAFKKALLIDKDSTDALFGLGYGYFLNDDYANAMRFFNRVEEMGAARVEMYQVEMAMFADSDDYEMAIRCANRAIQIEPLNVAFRINKAEIYVMQGRVREAVATLRELQEILPDEAGGYAMEAEVLIQSDDLDGALDALDRAIKRFPEDPSLYALKARALNNAARYQEALACCVEASKYETEDEAVKQDLILQQGIALGGSGKVAESIEVLEESAGKDVTATTAYYTLMNECIIVGQFEKAEECARKVIALGDEVEDRIRASAVFCLALAVQRQGRTDESMELFKDAARTMRHISILNPGLYEVYAYRIVAHRELGEYDEALELCDHLIAVDGGSASSLAFKAEVLEAKGDQAAADELKSRVLSMDPEFTFGVANG